MHYCKGYSHANYPFFLRLGLSRQCSVSLPQWSNGGCNLKRKVELGMMKYVWKLKVSPYGYALLNASSKCKLIGDLINPFTRFYLEGYLQTVISANLGHRVYNALGNIITDKEISHPDGYRILSKFFEMSAMSGGVWLTFCLFVCLLITTTTNTTTSTTTGN